MTKHSSMTRRARITAPLGFLALAFLAACGENGFLPPGSGGDEPAISSLALSPDPVTEGDTLTVTVQASGQRSITQMRFQFRGALVTELTRPVPDAANSIDREFRIAIPHGTGPDSMLRVDVIAIDAASIESGLVTDSVFVVDATDPSVTLVTSPGSIGSGDPLEVVVTASDARGLATIGYVVVDATTGDTVAVAEEVVPANALEATLTDTISGPAINPTSLRVTGVAEDRSGRRGISTPRQVGLEDRLGPSLVILETRPDSTVPLGDSIQVRVEASDPAGIRRLIFIGLAARGDTLLGTDTVVTRFAQTMITFPRPGESTLPETVVRAPYLRTADDSTSEALTIVVLAEDALGNVTEVTKNMYVGGPDVALVYPTQDVAFGVGQSFEVRVRISDNQGIDSAKVFLGGAMNTTQTLALPARTDTPFVATTTINLPATEGTVTLSARAWNPEEVAGQSHRINIDVLQSPPSDVSPPVVSVTAEMLVPENSKPRMELNDILRITVSARDEGSAGLERVGFKMIASRGGSNYTISGSTPFNGSNSLEEHVFAVTLRQLYAQFGITNIATLEDLLPEEIDLRIHGFAADTMGSLACSVGIEEQRPCTPATYTATGTYEAADSSGLLMELTVVRGHTVLLDNRQALIADLAVDTIDDRLFLSNITENLVEMLDLDEDPALNLFQSPVQVGSQPWGIFIGDRVVGPGDTARTLIVGNSGGTNVSLVQLDPNPANVQEVDVVRLRTPNAVLHEISERVNEAGQTTFLTLSPPYDFSDRPQFLAQDSLLRIVYSTVPTDAANTSTVRYIAMDPDPTSTADVPEARFLLHGNMVNAEANSTLALANIDSIQIRAFTDDSDSIRVFTHEPGYPDNLIFNTTWYSEVVLAVEDVTAQIDAIMTARGQGEEAPMFYPFLRRGSWLIENVGLSDTTFVSASGDRGRIAIGEGASEPTGRIILWDAAERAQLSSEIQILDLINNASERVLGVGLNWDGSLGVARGAGATYFFTPDLRLQGLYQQPQQGGAGATFHPDHDSVMDGGHTDASRTGVAFTGTPTRSVEVVNTFHFNRINELAIRDNIVGPLRSGPPLASDNGGQGRACAGEDCVVMKLYGITDAGGVVIINVRRRDLANP